MVDPNPLCCSKLTANQNQSSEVINCVQNLGTCCLLTPIEYDLNVFSQDSVPIYGCKGVDEFSNLQLEADNSKAGVNLPRFIDDLDYSTLIFPKEIWHTREPWEITIKTVAVAPLVLIAIFGNLSIIKIILTRKAMRKNPINLFIFNMSIADLLCALIFPWIVLIYDFYQQFILGPFICKSEGFVLVTLMLSSVFTLSVISFDRLIAIVLPFNLRLRPKSAKWIIIVIWILACAISSPLIFYRTYKERQWKDFFEMWCSEDISKVKHYWTALMILLVWLPLSILTLSYTTIVIKLDTIEKRQRDQPISQIKHKSKVIRMLFLVVLVFSICWVPFTLMIFIRNHSHGKLRPEVTDWFRTLFFVSHYLMCLNSAINPIIYGLMNDNFKRELRNHGVPSCLKKHKKVEVSTVLGNAAIGVQKQNQMTEKTKFQKVAAKYGLVLSTTSSGIPSLSSFDRRNSALLDLGLPIPISKGDSSSNSFLKLNYDMFKQ